VIEELELPQSSALSLLVAVASVLLEGIHELQKVTLIMQPQNQKV